MLHHVTHELSPAQLRQCISFYEALGFRQVPVPEGIGDRAVWLQAGPTQIHLMPRDQGVSEGRSGHVAVVLADYDSTIERLLARGHEVDPRRPHWGSPRSYVRDPAGHLVELMAFPPQEA